MRQIITKLVKGLTSTTGEAYALSAGVLTTDPCTLIFCGASAFLTGVDAWLALREAKSVREIRERILKLEAGQQLAADVIARTEGLDVSNLPVDDVRRFHLIIHQFLSGEFDDASRDRHLLRQSILEQHVAVTRYFEEHTEERRRLISIVLNDISAVRKLLKLTSEDVTSLRQEYGALRAQLDRQHFDLVRRTDVNAVTPPMAFLPQVEEGNRFVYRQRRVPLFGRTDEMNALREFLFWCPNADGVADFRWWLWTGPGGTGKSRLAYELCFEADYQGWHTGFLDARMGQEPPFADWHRWYVVRPTLLVVDYVAERADQIKTAIMRLTVNHSHITAPLRILLLERSAKEDVDRWTDRLIPLRSDRGTFFEFAWDPDSQGNKRQLAPHVKQVAGLDDDALWDTMQYVWDDLDNEETPVFSRPGREESLEALSRVDNARRPLFAALTAEAIAIHGLTDNRKWNDAQEIAELILQREFESWRMRLLADWEASGESGDFRREFESHLNLVLFATLVGSQPVSVIDRLREEGGNQLWLSEEVRPSWLRAITGFTVADAAAFNGQILPLEPDVLGGLLVLERLTGKMTGDCRSARVIEMIRGLRDLAWKRNPHELGAFIARCIADFPEHPGLDELIAIDVDPLSPPVGHPTVWASVLVTLVAKLGERKVTDRTPSMNVARRFCETALRVYTKIDSPTEWAICQYYLGMIYGWESETSTSDHASREIRCFQRSLDVFSEEEHSWEWAMLHSAIGHTYSGTVDSNDTKTLELAEYHLSASMKVWTRQEAPENWARNQIALGISYAKSATVDNPDNICKAIVLFHEAWEIFSEDKFPEKFNLILQNVAIAMWKLVRHWNREYEERFGTESEVRFETMNMLQRAAKYAGDNDLVDVEAKCRQACSMLFEETVMKEFSSP